MFFLQMAGYPGSGKSTLARLIAQRTGAVIVDHDIVKTGLLDGMAKTTGVDGKAAGPIAYQIDWSLVAFHLSCGHDVIYDAPCYYAYLSEGSRTGKA